MRRAPYVQVLQVPVQQLVDLRSRPRVAVLVDLSGQASQHPLCFSLGARAGRDNLAEVVASAAHRVESGVDRDPQRSAR